MLRGRNMDSIQKFKNLASYSTVAFVVDDIASTDPWRVRCLEIRGQGEAIVHPTDSAVPFPSAIIRVHATRIISFGVDPAATSRGKRNVG